MPRHDVCVVSDAANFCSLYVERRMALSLFVVLLVWRVWGCAICTADNFFVKACDANIEIELENLVAQVKYILLIGGQGNTR